MFRNANVIVDNGTVNSGDYFFALGRANNANITLQDSGSVISNVATADPSPGVPAFDGGNIGGSGTATVNLTLLGNSVINVHAASFDLAGNTAGTNTINMSGNSVIMSAGLIAISRVEPPMPHRLSSTRMAARSRRWRAIMPTTPTPRSSRL